MSDSLTNIDYDECTRQGTNVLVSRKASACHKAGLLVT